MIYFNHTYWFSNQDQGCQIEISEITDF